MSEIREIAAARADKGGGQMPLRAAEAKARGDAARFLTRAETAGVGTSEASRMLLVREATAREWRRRWEEERLEARRLGRPPRLCPQEIAADVKRLLGLVGPCGSVEYVWEQFPEVARAVIEELVRSFKKELGDARKAALLACTWTKPGTVWAADWTAPDFPLDGGRYPQALVVRDLASGCILLAFPAERTSAGLAAFALDCLFALYGAPLVLKTDNGPEFIAEDFRKLLRERGVTHLLSPEYYPAYNGAIEAGIGSLKTRAMYCAARNGRVGFWTCDDLEAGRLQANETSRPRGAWGPSPEGSWRSRERITDDERRRFRDLVDEETKERLAKIDDVEAMGSKEKKAVVRHAIASALAKCECLTIKRRRVSPAITHAISSDIT
jgi:transposase InsO family protein